MVVKTIATGDHGRAIFFKLLAVGGLYGRLTQQLLAVAEGFKQLLVQVGAVSQYHQGGVVHFFSQHQFASVKDHGKTFATALGMPHHTSAFVAFGLFFLGTG